MENNYQARGERARNGDAGFFTIRKLTPSGQQKQDEHVKEIRDGIKEVTGAELYPAVEAVSEAAAPPIPAAAAFKAAKALNKADAATEVVVKSAKQTVTQSQEMTRVGRWMNQSEYDKMKSTGRVQADSTGQHRVAIPAKPDAYKAAPKKDFYVEYDVPTSSLGSGGTDGWRTISGPGSPKSRLAKKKGEPEPKLPEFENISEPKQVKE